MTKQAGQMVVIIIAALGVVLFSVLFIIAGSQLYFQNAAYSVDAEKATSLAEAGVDKALATINRGAEYTGEGLGVDGVAIGSSGDGEYSVKITAIDAANKTIEATGYVPNKAKVRAKRTIKIIVSRGVGASFVYGIQVGEGGLELGNSNIITGSIYSNGSISGGNGNEITGDVWVAAGPQATADQQTDCSGSNCQDEIFGTSVAGSNRLDIAQSFQPTISTVLNRISLKVKKFGNPSNITVRIMADKTGEPDKNGVLSTGTLDSNLVSVNYGWIDVAFDSLPNLSASTTYWMMIDTSLSTTDYWSWQNDWAKSYTCGNPDKCLGKWSSDWKAGNPVWSQVTNNGDLSFRTYMGGAPTSVNGGIGKGITVKKDTDGNGGNVHANTIKNITMQAGAYYKVIENSTAASYNPNSDDPPPKVFPLSDANVADWENQAEQAGIFGGDITTCLTTLGETYRKIVGSVTFNSNCNVTVKTPLWITGDLTINSNNILRLSSEYGAASGVIVVDGKITLGSSNKLEGAGVGSSILMALSKYDSRTDGIPAIIITNIGNSGVFYASRGIVEPGNHNTFKELTAWGIRLVNNGTLNYETGLSSTIFSSGPSGTYSLVKGTYQLK